MSKQWAWSYSKYKNYAVCPKRHYEVDIAKHFNDSSEQLDWGNSVHAALATAVKDKVALPDSMKDYQRWVTEATVWTDAQVLVEQKYAITKDFQPTSWFGNDAWFRGIADLLLLKGPVGLARDYKTGKVLHDSRQLMLMTTCIFAHHKTLKRLKTEFIWLKDDCKTEETFDRGTIMREWPPVLTGVQEMMAADKAMNYPPKPGRLCARYCPVVSCPFHGKRHS